MRDKQIQIPMVTFNDLLSYFFCENYELEETIKKALEKKLEATIRHDLYSKYKTAPTEEEKEAARQEYLDRVGMGKDWRW